MLSRWNQHLPVVTSSELVECLIFAVHQEATLYHSHKEMLTYFVDVALWEVSKEQDSRCDEINRPYTLLTKQRSMVCQVYHLLFHGTIWSKLVCPTCKVDLKASKARADDSQGITCSWVLRNRISLPGSISSSAPDTGRKEVKERYEYIP